MLSDTQKWDLCLLSAGCLDFRQGSEEFFHFRAFGFLKFCIVFFEGNEPRIQKGALRMREYDFRNFFVFHIVLHEFLNEFFADMKVIAVTKKGVQCFGFFRRRGGHKTQVKNISKPYEGIVYYFRNFCNLFFLSKYKKCEK